MWEVNGKAWQKASKHSYSERCCQTITDDCYEVVSVETDNLSGKYYEDKYLPYRDTEFEKIDFLHSGAETIIGDIQRIIDILSEHISYLYENELYYYVDVPDEWD